MAKKKHTKTKKAKLKILWIFIPVAVLVLLALYGLFKNNMPQPPESSRYVIYQDSAFGFSIEYPEAWKIKKNTQVFENGDVIAFRITGPTQKELTELTDGAQVAVSKPFSINKDLGLWTKEYFGNKAEFSKFPTGDRVFEQVYICGLGCMKYFFTLVNNQVYGVAIFEGGPDKDKMVYENTTLYMLTSLKFANVKSTTISKEEAIEKIKLLPEVIDYLKRVPNGLVQVNGEENNSYLVQVYEFKNGHTATFNWYTVNKSTGIVENQF